MIDTLIQYFALFVLIAGVIYYTVKQMKKTGVIFVLVTYAKWFVGVCITFLAFYIIYLSGNYLKEKDLSVVFSLPIGVLFWFVPLHYTTKMFTWLENKYKKEEV